MLKNILYLSILTTLVVLASVFLSIYHNLTTTTAAEDTTIQVTAIPSTFNTTTITGLKSRKVVSADLSVSLLSQILGNTGASQSATLLTPTPTPLLTASTGALLTLPVTIQATSSSKTNSGNL